MPKVSSVAKQKQKKGSKKKKLTDAFLKKDWYVVKVPKWTSRKEDNFRVGYSPATKGRYRQAMENRTFVINVGDLQNDDKKNAHDDLNWKKYKFKTEEVFGDKLLTQWDGMGITRDKRCSLIRKWHSMIECFCDGKTTDGYVLRVKALAFTKKQSTQIKKNCYAKTTQLHAMRAKMREIMRNAISSGDLKSFVAKLGKSTIGTDIRKSCQLFFPLKVALIEKVKVIRKPKKGVAAIMSIHELKYGFDPIKEVQSDDESQSGDEDDSDFDSDSEPS